MANTERRIFDTCPDDDTCRECENPAHGGGGDSDACCYTHCSACHMDCGDQVPYEQTEQDPDVQREQEQERKRAENEDRNS